MENFQKEFQQPLNGKKQTEQAKPAPIKKTKPIEYQEEELPIKATPPTFKIESKPDEEGNIFVVKVWDNAFNPERFDRFISEDGWSIHDDPCQYVFEKKVTLGEVRKDVKEVLEAVTGTKRSVEALAGELEIRKFVAGGPALPHLDGSCMNGRMSVVLFYLSTDREGGTTFPKLNNTKIDAVAGRVVAWEVQLPGGKMDPRGEHYASASNARYSLALRVHPELDLPVTTSNGWQCCYQYCQRTGCCIQ